MDSRYLEVLSIIEAANAKVRDLRKLRRTASPTRKRADRCRSAGDDPLALRSPETGSGREEAAGHLTGYRTPGIGAQEGRDDHDQGL
ncbi:MAG: hypothetical protein RQM90_08140 [Methanoculleus sp.]